MAHCPKCGAKQSKKGNCPTHGMTDFRGWQNEQNRLRREKGYLLTAIYEKEQARRKRENHDNTQ